MSLNFNFEEIKNYKELCWVESGETNDAGEQLMKVAGVTDAIVWATIAIGMGSITEKNYVEFATRMVMWQGVVGTLLYCAEADDEGNTFLSPKTVELEDVVAHIGLKTNASKKTRTQFMKDMERAVHEGQRGAPS